MRKRHDRSIRIWSNHEKYHDMTATCEHSLIQTGTREKSGEAARVTKKKELLCSYDNCSNLPPIVFFSIRFLHVIILELFFLRVVYNLGSSLK